MRLCLMVEGQEDVTWEQWLSLARACEDSGLEGLFRSDHYLSVQGRRERGSMDAWATLSALAARTRRIRLGTLVSPATFRHPSVLAKMAASVDHVSGGRVELGMGAGWLEAEHGAYGFAFPDDRTRLEILAEQVEVVRGSWGEGPFSYSGKHYRLEDLDALPKPLQQPHPPLIIGGSAGRASARLAADWADEYNTVFASVDECRRRRGILDRACRASGRDPSQLTFSLMTGCVVGADRHEVRRRAARIVERSGARQDPDEWLAGLAAEWVVGTVDEAVEKLRALQDAGVERLMLQHQAHEDVEMVHLVGREVAPKVM